MAPNPNNLFFSSVEHTHKEIYFDYFLSRQLMSVGSNVILDHINFYYMDKTVEKFFKILFVPQEQSGLYIL